ncbi:IS481 family transposase ISGme9 [Geothermobacter hydrogeniphilus]|uniref:IS481 family transposase ISGme9 n=1 Tax=Geothermobacter hydrogeniphilus TaxID=1969733 RepID=A0A2K2HBS9_9BACT|nr:helix-turn-helix domain-containing protein [Geothermobacter hydrogeniphilus]PNU20765.1 IS481 family transposase ISGme9 [Geothermobacter hydrogeniphilus]
MKEEEKQRILAVRRFFAGEKPDSICSSLGRSRPWLYKWIRRHSDHEDGWFSSLPKRPVHTANRTPFEIEEIVKLVRLNLYNQDLFCGAQAIRWELEDLGVSPLPSLRTINRILKRNDLTHRRTGKYEPKGTPYPKLPSLLPNQTHQMDMVGPCYLTGPIRFYGINVIDTATARCGLHSSLSKSGQDVLDGLWAIWLRLGIPDNLQVDNAMSFLGSPRFPRAVSQFVRLCLLHDVEPWFVPMAEPWRNGIIEKFNDHYQQKFLSKVTMTTTDELAAGTMTFELRHNSSYRYSKLGGKTPIKALSASKATLKFPNPDDKPQLRLEKPEAGRYHFVRLIRSDLRLNILGELFPVPPELKLEYVVATIDVKEQKLKLYLGKTQVDEFDYKIR